ncbi:hypothetical protein LTR84_006984 [Exophiala bonariae]|uniref:Ketoreductase domain-containing protein n=1 Tax=Exophiala bonariae TaxID=1690606 RepID=A0AAV9MZM8_9EURO|nr:hypothetical protein LTR84_006984 [Exophiala bonariae]
MHRILFRRIVGSPVVSFNTFPQRVFYSTTCHRLKQPRSIIPDHTLPPDDVQDVQQSARKAVINDLFSLGGRTVVVTGAGRGLGITLASAVLEAGADVVCLDVLPEPSDVEWNGIMKTSHETGRRATYHQCDITSEDQVQAALATAAAQAGERKRPIRGLVSCAGVQQMVDAIDYPAEGFRRILDINVTGNFLVAKHAARLMRNANTSGSILFIASMSGQIANRGIHCTAYNTSKAAVQQMTRSLSVEWGRYGIRVNSLSPGYIRTAMTDQLLAEKPEIEKTWMAGASLGRLGSVEDFKAPAVYVLGDGASFMTGADLRVDGGHCASA